MFHHRFEKPHTKKIEIKVDRVDIPEVKWIRIETTEPIEDALIEA